MPGVPGPDGRHDDLEADELEGLALLVPDDARSLDADRAAYLREVRRGRRGATRADGSPRSLLVRALVGVRTGPGFAGPLLLVLLVVVGLVGSTLSVFGTTPADPRVATPLATGLSAPPGTLGGLLPNATVTLTLNGKQVQLRDARPAVLVMVPASCPDCGPILQSLRSQAAEYQLAFVIIGPPAQQRQLAALNATALGGSEMIVSDDGDVMLPAYTPSGVTAVMVRDDGTVPAVARDVTATTRLESSLSQLDGRTAPVA
jgi:hypothetical protein